MDEKVLSLLEKTYKKLDKLDQIEDQVSIQNNRINSLERKLLCISGVDDKYDEKEQLEYTQHRQSRNENFINQMKAELQNTGNKKREAKHRSRSKVKKAESFQEKSTRIPVRVRRKTHTVPSDKDEERRLDSFRRQCLSKALQWNLVDLLKAALEEQIIFLPEWLSKDEIKIINKAADRKNHLRRFFYILIDKDFVTMKKWLWNCMLDKKVVEGVWETFEEFSDIETNKSRMKCFRCRLVETVNVQDVVDYLFSAEIISLELCLRISGSELIVGAQGELWKEVLEECKSYIHPQAFVIALRIAMTDKLRVLNGEDKVRYESLLSLTEETDSNGLLKCCCQERCSKSFHPISCLKTMSLAGVYFSPPPVNRKREKSSSSDNAPSNVSTSTSFETLDEESKIPVDITTSPDDDTDLKKPVVPPRLPKQRQGPGTKNEIAKVQDSSQRDSGRRSRQREVTCQSESSSECLDGEEKPPIPVRNSFKSVTNMSSQKLENKPNVIRAQNVIFNTGPKYVIGKGKANKYISESSSSC